MALPVLGRSPGAVGHPGPDDDGYSDGGEEETPPRRRGRGSQHRLSRAGNASEYRMEKLQRRLAESRTQVQGLEDEVAALKQQLRAAEQQLAEARDSRRLQEGGMLLLALRDAHDCVMHLAKDQQLLQRGAEAAVRAAGALLAARVKQVDEDHTAAIVNGCPSPQPPTPTQKGGKKAKSAGDGLPLTPRSPTSAGAGAGADEGALAALRKKIQDLLSMLGTAEAKQERTQAAVQRAERDLREARLELSDCCAERDGLHTRVTLIGSALLAVSAEVRSLRQLSNQLRWKVRYLNTVAPGSAWKVIRRHCSMIQRAFLERSVMLMHDRDASEPWIDDTSPLAGGPTQRGSFKSYVSSVGNDDGETADTRSPLKGQSYFNLVTALEDANKMIEHYQSSRSDADELRREVEMLHAHRRAQADRERGLRCDLDDERRSFMKQRIDQMGTGRSLAESSEAPSSARLTQPPGKLRSRQSLRSGGSDKRSSIHNLARPKWNNSTSLKFDPGGGGGGGGGGKDCKQCGRPLGDLYTGEDIEGLFATIERLRATASNYSQQVSELRGKLRELNDVRDWVRSEKRRLKKEQEARADERRRFERESRHPPRSGAHHAVRLSKQVSLLQSDLSDMRLVLREQQERSQRDQATLNTALSGQKEWNLGLAQDLNSERQARIDLEDAHADKQRTVHELLLAREEAQEDGQQLRGAVDALGQRIDLLAQEIISAQQREQNALAEAEQLREELREAEAALERNRPQPPDTTFSSLQSQSPPLRLQGL
eukprot:TRINITY_DN2497_c0_g2_i1.p1 TRINITY_DN2497_c0_g2~~TRINITY_DN2497_c0_g2_i1.p1  ORF type:complete len:769 (+),score=301.44 TRINITY_DN2497_c0_g2_i1:60-2366(+)